MPYITANLRPIFDSIVVLVQLERTDDAIDSLIFATKDFPPEVLDGCLNYLFTQILRKTNDLTYAKIVIELMINEIFWSKPKYFRYERVYGLLNAMIDEYQRRAWRRQRKVVKVLKALLNMNAHYTSEYEEKKIAQNGDLE